MYTINNFRKIAIGIFIISHTFSFAQIDNTEREKRAQMHHEVPDDKYIPGSNINTEISPAYRSSNSIFFTTQVNIDANGQNIIGDAANEPSIAVDPVNPDRMAIGWRQFDNINNNFRQAGYGYTTDGGNSWTFPGVIDPGIFRSDPVLDADANGNFYYNSLTVDAQNNMSCDVYKIEDGGVDWDDGTYAHGGDKQWVAIDKSNGTGSGHNYSFWSSYWSICAPGAFTRSTDYGNSYEDCIEVSGDPYYGTLAVGPDGELYLAGEAWPNPIVVVKSTTASDPGSDVTWDFVTSVNLDGELQGSVEVNPEGLMGQAWIDVDVSNGPGRGNVYVLASVSRYSNFDPGDVMFAKSTDGGLTWSDPKRINDDLGTWDYQWFGTMSVAPNGRIDAVWLDTRDAPSNSVHSALYYSYSSDQGETWSVNEKLSELFDPHLGWPQQNKMGDYFDMTSDDLSAHLAWANTLNGEQDVYYGRITPPTVGVAEMPDKQLQFSLASYPNPSSGKSTLRYNLSEKSNIQIRIIDIYGQLVKNLLNEEQQAGIHNLTFEANDLPEGIYFCQLQVGEQIETIRIVLLR
ncbi:T9SS type A sorting domain-containing protein [Bacteroidota bacterium]